MYRGTRAIKYEKNRQAERRQGDHAHRIAALPAGADGARVNQGREPGKAMTANRRPNVPPPPFQAASSSRAFSAWRIFSALSFSASSSAISPVWGFKGMPSWRGMMWTWV